MTNPEMTAHEKFKKKLGRYLSLTLLPESGRRQPGVRFDHDYLLVVEYGEGVVAILEGDEVSVIFDPEMWKIYSPEVLGQLEDIEDAKGLAMIFPFPWMNFQERYQDTKEKLKPKGAATFHETPKVQNVLPKLKKILKMLNVHEVFGQKID